jgi:hypothetical protein
MINGRSYVIIWYNCHEARKDDLSVRKSGMLKKTECRNLCLLYPGCNWCSSWQPLCFMKCFMESV